MIIHRGQPLKGWREFKLWTGEEYLKSLIYHGPANTWTKPVARADYAPTKRNESGLHAYAGRMKQDKYHEPFNVFGNVVAWGRCMVAKEGFRAEHMEVLEVCVRDERQAARLRKNYPTLPIFIKTEGKNIFTPFDPPRKEPITTGVKGHKSKYRTVVRVL